MKLKQAVEKRVKEIAGFEEKSTDMQTLIDNLPPGQDPVCGEILRKYSVE